VALDLTTLTALATWVVAVGTIVILWWQTHVTQRLNGANAVMDLRERFDGVRMRRARRLLSQRLLEGKHEAITTLEVASFFELIGALTHRGVLDREMVWEAFGTWTTGYYYALRNPVDVIGRARTELKDPLIMHEFEWLYERTRAIDSRHVRSMGPREADEGEEARVLLRREIELDLD
jgi:predicted DNA-binding transcriptional regulator